MKLADALQAAGMTPPRDLVPGKWMRFPGAGKGHSNRSGWCRVIAPTLAIFGDWSTGLSGLWRDDAHQDNDESRRLLKEARIREQEFAQRQARKQREVAADATQMIRCATVDHHAYLSSKGFADRKALVCGQHLLVPMRDAQKYTDVINVQLIAPDGSKRFLTGGRAGGAVFALGPARARHTVLCEGYATGLSIETAAKMLAGPTRVVICFSAMNLERVAPLYPGAVVAADNDRSATGERVAQATGLKWGMPHEVGTDFNDLHQAMGLHAVVERIRELLS